MSNIKGQPGYIDTSAKPEPGRGPMTQSGRVIPPEKPRRVMRTAKQRAKARDAARDLVGKVCLGDEYLVIALRVDREHGVVQMSHIAADFPAEAVEDAGQLVAGLLGKIFEPLARARAAEALAEAQAPIEELAAKISEAPADEPAEQPNSDLPAGA